MVPEGGGMTLTYSAECIGDGHTDCDWTAEGPKSNREAERHTESAKHVTTTHARMEGGKR
jgi:hypothetical protein